MFTVCVGTPSNDPTTTGLSQGVTHEGSRDAHFRARRLFPWPHGPKPTSDESETRVLVAHTTQKNDNGSVRGHAQHTEELLERTVLPDKRIAHLRERPEKGAVYQRRSLATLRCVCAGNVVPVRGTSQ